MKDILYDVFISFSTFDQKVVEGICGYLEREGYRCFVSYRDIPRGVSWADAIAEAIEHSAMMLAVFSENFNKSKQTSREIELAAEEPIPILTFRLMDARFTGAKKYYLKNLNWIDAFPEPEKVFGQLFESVQKLVGRKETKPDVPTSAPPIINKVEVSAPAEPVAPAPAEPAVETSAPPIAEEPAPKPKQPQPYAASFTNVLMSALQSLTMSLGISKPIATHKLDVGKMVGVVGGTFTMGATSEQGSEAKNNEKPAHTVEMGNFYIGAHEVTQGLWYDVMGTKPSYFQGSKTAFSSQWRDLPVERVSWDDCQEFIRKLNARKSEIEISAEYRHWNFRLPTEAEWEYAARGGKDSKGYKYSGSDSIDSVAWYGGNCSVNGNRQTHPVGTKQPNELGIYDMSGNVWEWCQDWYDENFYSRSPRSNPCNNTSASYCVLRGGSWSDDAQSCCVAFRDGGYPDNWISIFGLRLVLAP